MAAAASPRRQRLTDAHTAAAERRCQHRRIRAGTSCPHPLGPDPRQYASRVGTAIVRHSGNDLGLGLRQVDRMKCPIGILDIQLPAGRDRLGEVNRHPLRETPIRNVQALTDLEAHAQTIRRSQAPMRPTTRVDAACSTPGAMSARRARRGFVDRAAGITLCLDGYGLYTFRLTCIVAICGGTAPRGAPVREWIARRAAPPSA